MSVNRVSVGLHRATLAACALVVPALPSLACETPGSAFAEGSVIADTRPRLEWPAVQGATGYRLRLRSRVPNGRVVAASDTVLDKPAFAPPQPLAEMRAKVTVRVKAICGKEESAETVTWFLIDTSAACRLGELEVTGARVEWAQVPGAKSYELRRYALFDGRLLDVAETRGSSFQFAKPEASVLSVRPACAGGLGEAVYRVLAR